MESIARPRIVIAGTNSGVGKTTIVTGLLAYFHSKGYAVQPFKVGPDIDPGFHGKAAGRNSYNLDTWMTPPDRLVPTFASLSKGADISIIEGVMGLYDGGANGSSKGTFVVGAHCTLVDFTSSTSMSSLVSTRGFGASDDAC